MRRKAFIVMFVMLSQQSVPAETMIPLHPEKTVDGRGAPELSAEWWKWAKSTPAERNPVRDTSGINCGVGQHGNIWHLAGGFGSSKIKRRCEVPFGKYILFPIINMAYWPRTENNGLTCKQAQANAAVNNDAAIELFVELDGVTVKNPKQFRAKTKECFDVLERVREPGERYNAYPSASDGYWILLEPPQKGLHQIKFGGKYRSPNSSYGRMMQDIEYEILVN